MNADRDKSEAPTTRHIATRYPRMAPWGESVTTRGDDDRKAKYVEAVKRCITVTPGYVPPARPKDFATWMAEQVMVVADAEIAQCQDEMDLLSRDNAEAFGAWHEELARAEAAERALADQRARVARVEALIQRKEENPMRGVMHGGAPFPVIVGADEIRAALDGDS